MEFFSVEFETFGRTDIFWQFNWSFYFFIDWLIDRLIGWFIYRLFVCLIDWLIDWLNLMLKKPCWKTFLLATLWYFNNWKKKFGHISAVQKREKVWPISSLSSPTSPEAAKRETHSLPSLLSYFSLRMAVYEELFRFVCFNLNIFAISFRCMEKEKFISQWATAKIAWSVMCGRFVLWPVRRTDPLGKYGFWCPPSSCSAFHIPQVMRRAVVLKTENGLPAVEKRCEISSKKQNRNKNK